MNDTEATLRIMLELRLIRAELAGIRAALLERSADAALPVPVAAEAECEHPDAARVDFCGMGDEDEWECAKSKGGCGERFTSAMKGLIDG